MKSASVYVILLAVIFASVSFVIVLNNKRSAVKNKTDYALKERSGELALLPEWPQIRNSGRLLLTKIKNNPADYRSRLQLIALFIREGRITGDHIYYDRAALKYAEEVLRTNPDDFEALVYKAVIQMSQHHFSEGLATAIRAQAINPYNAYVYGIMVDGFVELGDYEKAVETSDKMVSIRPDLSSYARIAYLREIHGDLAGAVEAMKLAVDAGMAGDETTEWSRVQLGKLYEKTGDLTMAERQYIIASNERPGYAFALAGLGGIARSRGMLTKAIEYYEKAAAMIEDFSIRQELATIYKQIGENQKAESVYKEIIGRMVVQSEAALNDETIGHYSDAELAHIYITNKQYDKALKHARLEYNRRPDNIDVNETMAWCHYKAGEFEQSRQYLQKALRTGSRNPVLLIRSALIYKSCGEDKLSKSLLDFKLLNNPSIPADLKDELSVAGLHTSVKLTVNGCQI